MTDPQRLTLTARDSRSEGSCNFCNRHAPSASGMTPNHTVYVASSSSTGGGATVRFCTFCLHDFVRLAEGL